MANHIKTRCTVTGPDADIAALIAAHIVVRSSEEAFDLATVVPRPAIVDQTESGSEADAGFFALTGFVPVNFIGFGARPPVHHYIDRGFAVDFYTTPDKFAAWLAVNHPGVLEKGRKQVQCFRETGSRSWYDWSYANWGTKWNSYDYAERERSPGRFVFAFDTANGVPVPVLAKLAERWPSLAIETESIDEGGPEYVGQFRATGHEFARAPDSDERYVRIYGRPRDEDESAVTQ